MNKVVRFGEIMLRLTPPVFLRFSQANSLNVIYGGRVFSTIENLSEWFNAGVTYVGMGSKLIMKDNNGQHDLQKIKKLLEFGYVN